MTHEPVCACGFESAFSLHASRQPGGNVKSIAQDDLCWLLFLTPENRSHIRTMCHLRARLLIKEGIIQQSLRRSFQKNQGHLIQTSNERIPHTRTPKWDPQFAETPSSSISAEVTPGVSTQSGGGRGARRPSRASRRKAARDWAGGQELEAPGLQVTSRYLQLPKPSFL